MAGSTVTRGLRGYRDLLVEPGVARVVGWGLIARAPVGMVALAMVLLLRGEGRSYADAGLVSAAEAVAFAVASPLAGRLIDRHRPAVVLAGYGIAFPVALLVTMWLVIAGAPLAAVVAASACAGIVFPPIAPTVRMLWPSMVGAHLHHSAFALEATLQEVLFVSGPLVVGGLTAIAGPRAGVVAAAVVSLVGVLGFAATSQVRRHRPVRHDHGDRHLLAALSPGVVRGIVGFSVCYGLAFGAVEVAMPAFAEQHGGRALGSVCLAAWSAGSLAGGLLAAGHRPENPRRGLQRMSVLFAAALVLPLLAWSVPAMTVVIFLAGLPIAPSFAITYGMAQSHALPGTQAEVFSWLSTSVVLGIAAGAAAGGALITSVGTRASLTLGIVGAVAAVLVATASARRGAQPPA
ncbi:MAG TPA: MFS transporter [Gaiellales bacterium]|nr:MFS transporter [Gaiellales bacterium]